MDAVSANLVAVMATASDSDLKTELYSLLVIAAIAAATPQIGRAHV